MQVFELHLNSSTKKQDAVFDSFCYEPENIYEKKIGALYLVGALKNVLPKNIRLLDNLAAIVKENYYRTKSIELMTPEKSLKQSLEETNEYLEKIAKSGDVSWLGNLSFAVLSIVPNRERYIFNLAKVNDLKILVLRDKQIIDIEQKLTLEGIEPYPLKIFNNIISGELIENDLLLILTKEVFESFSKQGLLDKIANIALLGEEDKSSSSTSEPRLTSVRRGEGRKENEVFFDFTNVRVGEDKLLKILKTERNLFSKISGVCLLIVLSHQSSLLKKKIGINLKIPEFSFKQTFSRLYSMNALRSFRRFASLACSGIQLNTNLQAIKISKNTKRKIILILILAFLLVLGFFIF